MLFFMFGTPEPFSDNAYILSGGWGGGLPWGGTRMHIMPYGVLSEHYRFCWTLLFLYTLVLRSPGRVCLSSLENAFL